MPPQKQPRRQDAATPSPGEDYQDGGLLGPLHCRSMAGNSFVAVCASCKQNVQEGCAGTLHGCVSCNLPIHTYHSGSVDCSVPALYVTGSSHKNLQCLARSDAGLLHIISKDADSIGICTNIWLTAWCVPCLVGRARQMVGTLGLLAANMGQELQAPYVLEENRILADHPEFRFKLIQVSRHPPEAPS